jgi:hypothetical protein
VWTVVELECVRGAVRRCMRRGVRAQPPPPHTTHRIRIPRERVKWYLTLFFLLSLCSPSPPHLQRWVATDWNNVR